MTKYPTDKKAKIIAIDHTFGSGLVEISLEDSKTHERKILGGDARVTFNSLEEAFGGIQAAKGKEIYYIETSYGAIASFLPVDKVVN